MTTLWIKLDARGLLFKIVVQPRSSRNKIAGLHDDALKIKLTAPPVDGAANKMVVTYLAQCLDLPKSRLEIKTGHTGRQKQIRVHCPKTTSATGEVDRIKKKIELLAGG